MATNDVETAVADDRERKTIREHWLELNRKYEVSGMTREDFCAQEKVSVTTFDNQRATFKKEGLTQDVRRPNRKSCKAKPSQKKDKKQANALLPVVITPAVESQPAIEIRTSKGNVVSVPLSVCPTILKEVLKALGDL